jgi:uncharacterized protein YggE
MLIRLLVLVLLSVLTVPGVSFSCDNNPVIKVQGESRMIITPDIAHLFLKITGEGPNYGQSTKAARSKVSILEQYLKEMSGKKPEISVMKIENKPKGKSFDDMYQKDFITGMAKAIKGEEPAENRSEPKKEMTTVISIYFNLLKFSEDEIIGLRTALSEKEIAFDKDNPFDFSFDYDTRTSAIFFGLKNPNRHLEKLSTEAFENARRKAGIIAQGASRNLGKLVGISGCSSELKGSVEISDRSNLTGRDLGPLSVDPNRLLVKFSTNYEFELVE